MRRNFIAPLLFLLGPLFLSGCGQDTTAGAQVRFVSNYVPIEFTFPSGSHLNQKSNPYELHCFSEDEQMVTGVFVFKKEDIETSDNPTDTLEAQVKDIESKRKNFKLLAPLAKYENERATFATVTYTGEKDSSTYCYKFTLIQFKGDDSKFAVVIQVGFPENWKATSAVLDEINRSARPLENEDQKTAPASPAQAPNSSS